MRAVWLYPILALFLSACSGESSHQYTELGSASHCDAATSRCVVTSGPAQVTLLLGPDVRPLRPFEARVSIQGMDVDRDSVVADFQMIGMDMGMNRYRLVADGERWLGKVTLPICTSSRMDWVVLIEFVSEGKRYRVRFPFQTVAS